ncbi:hypothetical protein P4H70_20630 [Paenibacillus ehimensis]|uniref:hypothetical protein n=1 Tax=Paenibacillus ehimensis TaxID=79264 RepID=UPI002DB7A3B4|nr:hypothetical protein [Paenibacillus ehimensis]MEC0211349.1 hypothetical protein [Paenibacillus ehimensis]
MENNGQWTPHDGDYQAERLTPFCADSTANHENAAQGTNVRCRIRHGCRSSSSDVLGSFCFLK